MSIRLITHDGTSTEFSPPLAWMDRAACLNKPQDFDLDVIAGDPAAVSAALNACGLCLVKHHCRLWTKTLTGAKQPQSVVQAGRLWPSRYTRLGGKFAGRKRGGSQPRKKTTP